MNTDIKMQNTTIFILFTTLFIALFIFNMYCFFKYFQAEKKVRRIIRSNPKYKGYYRELVDRKGGFPKFFLQKSIYYAIFYVLFSFGSKHSIGNFISKIITGEDDYQKMKHHSSSKKAIDYLSRRFKISIKSLMITAIVLFFYLCLFGGCGW